MAQGVRWMGYADGDDTEGIHQEGYAKGVSTEGICGGVLKRGMQRGYTEGYAEGYIERYAEYLHGVGSRELSPGPIPGTLLFFIK